eukprot:TRINITY_DN8217_c0_g1_i7.p1 TRINITY_DN8217_c0_g1~~TRINITY_DN8217_c0_g1_i7.p1  ORF type:complete len:813 (+),score=167.46 TRINITY_DN8217_c0_g1_i7:51-2489(+)
MISSLLSFASNNNTNNHKNGNRLIVAMMDIPSTDPDTHWSFSEGLVSYIVPAISYLRDSNIIQDVVFVGCPSAKKNDKVQQTLEISAKTAYLSDSSLQGDNGVDEFASSPGTSRAIDISSCDDYVPQMGDVGTMELDGVSNIVVDLPSDIYHRFEHFFGQVLWPLFHYNTQPYNNRFDKEGWEAFNEVNITFAECIQEAYQPGDLIWIQGSHLSLLPSILREALPMATIGLYIFAPFPSVDVYRMLPVREELLRGILGADLVGFQTYNSAGYFINACTRILGISSQSSGQLRVQYQQRDVSIQVVAVGIDPSQIYLTLSTTKRDNVLFQGKKVIIARDKLEDIEGTLLKLAAIEKLFEMYPNMLGKVVYVQVVEDISTLGHNRKRELSTSINRLVGKINGKYGALGYNPVEYIQGRHLDNREVYSLYSSSDIALITPVGEGMSVDPHQFVVCHKEERPGILILSEFNASARCFGGALLVNPYNTQEMAMTINHALTLDPKDALTRHSNDLGYALGNTCGVWAEAFVSDMKNASAKRGGEENEEGTGPQQLRPGDISDLFSNTSKRIIVINYEGALTPRLFGLSIETGRICNLLAKLAANKKTLAVYVITHMMRENLKHLALVPGVGVCAEDGCFIKPAGSANWTSTVPESVHDISFDSWQRTVYEAMEYYMERTPGTNVEVRAATLVWHYDHVADPQNDFIALQVNELLVLLQDIASKFPIDIVSGLDYIEVRPRGIGKVSTLKRILSEMHQGHDCLIYLGGEKSDEAVYGLPEMSEEGRIGCSIGDKVTAAKYYLRRQLDVAPIIEALANL